MKVFHANQDSFPTLPLGNPWLWQDVLQGYWQSSHQEEVGEEAAVVPVWRLQVDPGSFVRYLQPMHCEAGS